jgi:hypothetical protein
MSNASKLPPQIPFVIAVTGPIESIRDLPAERRTALQQLIKDQFFRVLFVPAIHARWTAEGTTVFDPPRLRSTPLLVLTNGAHGFDALVEEAIAGLVGTTNLPIRIVRMLPFDPTTPRRNEDIVLPKIREGVQPGDALQYRFAGYCMLRFARLLLTIDTGAADGVTQAIVHMARSGSVGDAELRAHLREIPDDLRHKIGLPKDALHELEPIGTVQLPAAAAIDANVFLRWLRPFSSEHEKHARNAFDSQFRETLIRLDLINQDIQAPPGRDGYAIEESPPAHLASMHDLFLHADAAASRNQRSLVRHLRRVHWLVFIGALSFVLASHWFPPISHWWSTTLVFGLALCVAVAALVHDRGRRQRLEARTWDLRNLSESLRVRFAWRRAGIRDLLAQHQLTYHRNELTWIRATIDSMVLEDLRADLRTPATIRPAADVARAIESWLIDQFRYYRRQVLAREGKSVQSENARSALIQVSVLFTIAAIFAFGRHDLGWGIALVGVSLAMAAWTFFRRREFHQDLLARLEPSLQATERGVRCAVWVFTGIVVVIVIGSARWITGPAGFDAAKAEHVWHNAFALLVILPALVGALLHARAESHGWSAEARRFAQMIHVYRGAIDRLMDLAELPESERRVLLEEPSKAHAKLLTAALESKGKLADPVVTALLRRVGSESLTEHAEWLFLHRDRPIDVPYHV